MNRLVIVGNGFDLAHGLPTGYCDFINHIWTEIGEGVNHKDLVEINGGYQLMLKGKVNSYSDFIKCLERYANINENNYKSIGWYGDVFYAEKNDSRGPYRDNIFEFTNFFFKIISKNSIKNWVDVENEYYELLKISLKENNNKAIKRINKQFEIVKTLLEDYLLKQVVGQFEYDIHYNNPILRIFCKNSYEGNELFDFYKELPQREVQEINNRFKKEQIISQTRQNVKIDIENIHFLSFNYTSLIKSYVFKIEKFCVCNEIHGELKSEYNPINFGFGDEMDKRYSEIEEKADNEYLKNIKSFAYSNTPNYKALLDLIESDKFQVYIMGHSCGLSDRTLLNTIFEHENCLSIKIFFHRFDNPKHDGSTDNYTEIVQNISRHFNKKKLMREKIVNKTLCQALPQIKLPLKERRLE